jgi:hypothetical protein
LLAKISPATEDLTFLTPIDLWDDTSPTT